MGHILEHHPDNIAQVLGRGGNTTRTFWTDTSASNQTPAEDPWNNGQDPWSQGRSDNGAYFQAAPTTTDSDPWYSSVYWMGQEDYNNTNSDTVQMDTRLILCQKDARHPEKWRINFSGIINEPKVLGDSGLASLCVLCAGSFVVKLHPKARIKAKDMDKVWVLS